MGISLWDEKEDAEAYSRRAYPAVLKALEKWLRELPRFKPTRLPIRPSTRSLPRSQGSSLSPYLWSATKNPDHKVVCVSALLVVKQAIWASKYFWAAGFLAIALLFNPLVPLPITGSAFGLLEWVCLAAFLVSLAVLKMQPTLSVLSITSRAPRSESL